MKNDDDDDDDDDKNNHRSNNNNYNNERYQKMKDFQVKISSPRTAQNKTNKQVRCFAAFKDWSTGELSSLWRGVVRFIVISLTPLQFTT